VTTKELIDVVVSLPVEERAILADSVLQSLDTPEPAIDSKWAKVAQQRLAELRSGKIKPIPGEQVFDRTMKRSE
jgi:putative addiction module component (TIGR02574 family)